jgi:hypothetical protein
MLPVVVFGEKHRFLVAVASELGVEIGEKVVDHRARTHGKSNNASPRR